MKELIFQMELMLICQINQKNVCSVIIGIFLDKNFSYGPYLCDGCKYNAVYNILPECNKLRNIAIVHVKKSTYRIYFLYMSKRKAKKLMIILIDTKGVL